MFSPIGHNNTKHFLCPIRSRHPLEFLELARWESVPRGSFALTWKLSSRLSSRPDWLPLGLRGWRMIVWSGWDSSIWKKLLKKISDCRSFSVLKILTGYWPYSRSPYYFSSKFFFCSKRESHGPEIYVSCIYQKLNITALQNCLNWCLIRDMVGQVNVFSWSFLKPIL